MRLRQRMIAQTSIEAYYEEVMPKLGLRQTQVYNALKSLGNASNMMIARYLGWSINRVTPRVLEMRNLVPPLIKESGVTQCSVTGRNAKYWEINKEKKVVLYEIG